MEGNSCIATGAGTELGRAIALLLGSRGCLLTAAGLDENSGRETVGEIVAADGKAIYVRTDIAGEQDSSMWFAPLSMPMGALMAR